MSFDSRNTITARRLLNSDFYNPSHSPNETLSKLTNMSKIDKAEIGYLKASELLSEKKVIMSPPKTDFTIQDYPLKRLKHGLSG